jgi:flagellar hook-basal body complex protein FliE
MKITGTSFQPSIKLSADLEKAVSAQKTDKTGFGDMLEQKIQEVDQLQQKADTQMTDFATGKTRNLHETILAMEMADTAIAVTRARETLKHSQWLAERRLPHLFAPRQELTGAGGAPLAILDVGEASRRLAYIRAAESARDAEIVESPTTTYSVEQST